MLRTVSHRSLLEARSSYSSNRITRFHSYSTHQTSFKHALLVLCGAPVPAILAMTLLEVVPLEPPSEGIEHSAVNWMRSFVFSMIVSSTLLIQLQTMIPTIPMKLWQCFVIAASSSAATTLTMLLAAIYIGYPLPFAINVGIPSYVVVFFCGVLMIYGGRWRQVAIGLRQFIILLIFQSTSLFIYPALSVGFVSVPSKEAQIAYTMIIPITKYILKQLLKRILIDFPDLSALFVILNAEVYHALFVSVCMQNSSSLTATLVLMAVDIGGVITTLVSLQRHVNSMLEALRHGCESSIKSSSIDVAVIDSALHLLRDSKVREAIEAKQGASAGVLRPPSFRRVLKSVAPTPAHGIKLSPVYVGAQGAGYKQLPSELTKLLDQLSLTDRITFVRQTLKLLHRTEMFLLAEYVEVVVPIIYCVYLVVIFHLPNRVFHDELAHLTVDDMRHMTTSVLGYASLQLLTFLPLGWILKRRLGFHAIHQLTFALWSDWWIVLAKMTTWLLFTVQGSLLHNGVDYTFQFEWLHQTASSR